MTDDVKNKNGITKEEEEILLDLYSRNSHFMTPGAKRAFNQIRIGYIILAVAAAVGIWAVSNRTDNHIRRDINRVAQKQCLAGIVTVNKYNDLVDSILKTRRDSLRLALKDHDAQQVLVNKRAIRRYAKDKIIPPTPAECKIHLLK
jgi:hypothetical protein